MSIAWDNNQTFIRKKWPTCKLKKIKNKKKEKNEETALPNRIKVLLEVNALLNMFLSRVWLFIIRVSILLLQRTSMPANSFIVVILCEAKPIVMFCVIS